MRYMTKQLEFNAILKAVAKYAKTDRVKSRIFDLQPQDDLQTIHVMLNEVDTLRSMIVQLGQMPLIDDFDIDKLINYAAIERTYSLIEIMHIRLFLSMEKDIINYYKNAVKLSMNEADCSHYFTALINHKSLLSAIDDKMDGDGVIKDDATPELLSIRHKRSRLDKTLQDKLAKLVTTYSKYLSDQVIVMRNGRFCIGVKETHKHQIKGVIHDVSASGQTIYIEPEQTRQVTAEIESLNVQEAKEIERIIYILSHDIQLSQSTMASNLKQFIELDFLQAKANMAISLNAIKPHINQEGMIDLKSAKHPLLDQKQAVPISLNLDHHRKTLLITGPNTGGKTVALKTLGLLTVMMQSGLLIPADQHTNLAVFKQVFADIGDEQSISQSLSTFSSHLTKIVDMLKHVSDQSLILLDEIGSGTDPNEGVSLAIAILNAFRKYDIRMMVTTHYSELKRYAYEQADIQTASVAFDKETLRPLYHIHMGTTGSSHAFLIAKRLGLPLDVINEANTIYKGRQSDLAKLMEQLNDEMVAVQEERAQLNDLKENALKEQLHYENARRRFIDQQNALLQKIKEKKLVKWQKQKDELTELLETLRKRSDISQPDYAQYKSKINQNIEEENLYIDEYALNVGDDVFILPYQQYGKVILMKDNEYEVSFGNFDLSFKRSDLRKEQPKTDKKNVVQKKSKSSSNELPKSVASLELDLRGFRYEEVAHALEQAIDRAMLSGLSTLRVIHGFGTGAVRKAVQTYIKKSPYVTSSRFGGEGEGLNGVTILTLK